MKLKLLLLNLLWFCLAVQPVWAALPTRTESAVNIYLPLVETLGGSLAAPIINSFGANPATIAPGATSTLSWDVSGADSVSISGVGPVTGASSDVQPGSTTEYTLTATNPRGSTTAQLTVTVTGGNSDASNFFLPYDLDGNIRINYTPQIALDGAGGVHVAYTARRGGAYYGYCPANCTSAASFTMINLGDGLTVNGLAVDTAGRPRLLVNLDINAEPNYVYMECNVNCTAAGQWASSPALGTGEYSESGVEAGHPFALDSNGHPRFVYSRWSVNGTDATFYLSCAQGCTDAANWQQTTLGNGYWDNLALAIGPDNLARLSFYRRQSDEAGNVIYEVDYLECNDEECSVLSGPLQLAQLTSGVAVFAMQLDTNGNPHMILYPGTGEGGNLPAGRLIYAACADHCTAATVNWSAVDINLPTTCCNGQTVYNGEYGLNLALDAQNRPRLAFRISSPIVELGYAWCNTNCTTSAQDWQGDIVPSREAADQELGHIRYNCPTCYPPISDCDSYWDAGWWPMLALDGDGDTYIVFEAQLWSYGGLCSAEALARFTRLTVYPHP